MWEGYSDIKTDSTALYVLLDLNIIKLLGTEMPAFNLPLWFLAADEASVNINLLHVLLHGAICDTLLKLSL